MRALEGLTQSLVYLFPSKAWHSGSLPRKLRCFYIGTIFSAGLALLADWAIVTAFELYSVLALIRL